MSDAAWDLVVADVTSVADGVVALELSRADGSALPAWSPGAHVDVHLASGLIRQYSLCGRTDDEGRWRLGVLREADGRGGSVEVHSLTPSVTLTVVGPRNHFELEEAPAYLLLAGGIGVTPILPMVRALSAGDVPWQVVYAGRTRPGMAFVDELAAVAGDRLRLHCDDVDGLIDLEGLLRAAPPGCAVYCCGPTGLINATLELAAAIRPDLTVRYERFAASGVPVDTSGDSFAVHLAATGATVTVGPDDTILETVRTLVPGVPSACEEGICGTCETRVLAGLPDHRDEVLSPQQRAANDTMMICVGRALSAELTLDL